MGKKIKNKMANHAVEATGLRVISMYVQEYFHWGWQPYNQENDDGIDGEIIPRYRDGQDMGVRIKVQSKSGPSYLSSMNNQTVNIKPYPKEALIKHIDSWNLSREPVIIVYTNAEKKIKGKEPYLDLKNPVAWWMRMDTYQHDGSSLIKIPRKNLFQEHTKGELVKMIDPYIKKWANCIQLKPEKKDLSIRHSMDPLNDAKLFYSKWKDSKPEIRLGGKTLPLIVSRTGWRHITDKARKQRVKLSLELLPIAKLILDHAHEIRPIELRSKYKSTPWPSSTRHLGYRARVLLDGREEKVQVVIKDYKNLQFDKEKIWFYSVHIVK